MLGVQLPRKIMVHWELEVVIPLAGWIITIANLHDPPCMVGQTILELQSAHISDDLSFDIIKTIKT